MESGTLLRQGHRMLQIGVALVAFISLEGFVIIRGLRLPSAEAPVARGRSQRAY